MKKKLKYINIIFFFLAVSIIEAKSQQKIKTELKTNDTILLKEIIISEDVTIDTTGLKILYVLQKVLEKPLTNKPEPCGDLDFIILYDDLSAVYFHLGCVWNTEKIYYVNKRDTLFFYPQDIGKMIKKNGMKQPAQIAKFILENGIKMHIGSIAGGLD
jgi:hypothetical protein